ncbi:DNA polymerase III subunit delta [Oceaniglobus ichthyenteri]|uniref:DNA polymerase III subunit delta n=1 Tax=Oceaniglobus ichthyenteri TaxID=2136177 RepID=UPI000D3B46FD|nr:DNA polymerase III subunit delta [Oceaniglobus ichthyenteri]
MILTGPKAQAFLAKPDPKLPAVLIYGADPMRVALKRQEAVKALIGPKGDEEMRLTRLPASDINKNAALVIDALKSQGFFPGHRVTLVEEANHYSGDTLTKALKDWQPGDATLIVTAGDLKKTSPVRKLFEKHPSAVCIAIYDNPPTAQEIDAELARANLTQIDPDARQMLVTLAQQLDPGDFRQTLEKLALYMLGDTTPVSTTDVKNCAPASTEADLDDMLDIVATGQSDKIGPVMTRLQSQGVNAVTLCIGTLRHFRTLHGLAVGARVFHPRARQLESQARGWGINRLEQALKLLTDTDLSLRSATRAPQMAVMERALIRLAMMGKR